jgi:hypothetical protein
MNAFELRGEYQRLSAEGVRLAGRLADVPQRAVVYHHVFFDSGRNHVFPLIAAHGALWARGYFAFGMRLARLLSWQYGLDPVRRREQLASVELFADVLRDINRRVCADTYASYHFTDRYGDHAAAAEIVAPALFDSLQRVHAARRTGRELSDEENRRVFEAHFLNEQTHVVGPTLTEALTRLRWPLVRAIAVKPLVQFSYFPRGERLWFANFTDRDERIAKGLAAFDLAARAGWQASAAALRDYAVLPEALFANARQHFTELREAILASAAA